MPMPSNRSDTRPSVKDSYDAMVIGLGAIKARSAALAASLASAAAPQDIGVLVSYLRDLVVQGGVVQKQANRPALQAYARNQLNDATFDLAAEWATTSANISAVISWFTANLPQNAAGFLLYEKLAADGTITIRKMPVADFATLVPLLNAVVQAID